MPPQASPVQQTAFAVILSISLCHMLNDIMQSLLSAIYPLLKEDFALSYRQIGLLTLCFQVTASLLQPAVGIFTDRKPLPKSLPVGMGSTFCGLILLAFAPSYPLLLLGAAFIGIGSAIFHPEASRVARMASGGRFGLAQSLFQVGGNFGSSIGPLLAAFIVVPLGRPSVAAFCLIAALGMIILNTVSRWYAGALTEARGRKPADKTLPLPRDRIVMALVVLAFLTFSKNIYTASISSYYTFYLIETFGLTTQQSQMMLFLYLAAVATGTIAGGPIGDRFGPLAVIWFSILGVLPFTLALPYANLFWTGALSVVIGLIIASAFPAIVVFAQELLPGRVGMVAGIFFGFAFGMGGIAAAVLGVMADSYGIAMVYRICAWLPILGLLTIFLPSHRKLRLG
ncbi:MAG: MFS transporter [Gemmobacter sp.]|nr:MFS transporter [Gemmobacter sp.]